MSQQQLETLKIFDTGLTKTEIKSMAVQAVDSVLEQGNPLQVAETLSAMESFIKEVKADPRFTNYVREEAVKTPKGFISNSGAKIEIAETGTRYDFSQCNDPEYAQLINEMEILEERIKARAQILKFIPLSGMDIITADGEAVKIYPPAKTSSSSYKVTLSK